MSKKLLMSNVNNTVVDDGWDFEWYASSGVLPPNDGADQNAIIRTFKDDYLEIFVDTNSGFLRFTPEDKLTSTNAILETLVCGSQLFAADNGIRIQVSNGEFGMQVKISSYNDNRLKVDKFYRNNGTRKNLKYLEVGVYYKVRLELEGDTTRIYVDDELLDTSNKSLTGTDKDVSYANGCSTTKNSVIFQGRTTKGCIKYIKFKEF